MAITTPSQGVHIYGGGRLAGQAVMRNAGGDKRDVTI